LVPAFAQSGGTISGTVSIESTGEMMHGARVVLSPVGRSVDSDDNGHYEFRNVAPGSYELLAQSPGLSADRVPVMMTAGASLTVDLKLKLSAVKETLTVTATGREETVANALQSVAVLDMTQLPTKSAASLG